MIKMSKKVKPDKRDLARMKALSDLGLTPTGVAKKLGCSHHTTIKYLNLPEIFEDSEVKRLVEAIKEKEVTDLYLLGAKARNRLHNLLDEGKTKMIETCAVMDRSFQQRRLLEGQSTQNIAYAEALRARFDVKIEMERLVVAYPELREAVEVVQD